jgi:two-component system, NarL family, invasion response regulator UvrY
VATITVLLADDNAAILSYLREELCKEFSIAGAVENGAEAVRAVLIYDPDVLVLDISMPVLNGLQVAARLHETHSRTKILFLTVDEDPEYVSAGFAAGASGYVTKRRLTSDLVHAIREVAAGRTFLSPTLRE